MLLLLQLYTSILVIIANIGVELHIGMMQHKAILQAIFYQAVALL